MMSNDPEVTENQAASENDGKPAPATEAENLQQELEQARAQSAEYLDGWQRARAELANAKRRFDKERSEAGQMANSRLILRLLPALDDMDRAIKNVPEDQRTSPWVEGMALIYRKLQNTLESEGVKPIEVKPGDQFDPKLHEALTHEENENYSEGQVIAEVQKGYRFGDQVLRPALVRVAR